jgi:hypothetical protein
MSRLECSIQVSLVSGYVQDSRVIRISLLASMRVSIASYSRVLYKQFLVASGILSDHDILEELGRSGVPVWVKDIEVYCSSE